MKFTRTLLYFSTYKYVKYLDCKIILIEAIQNMA